MNKQISKEENQNQPPKEIGYSNPINQQGNIKPQKIIENSLEKKNDKEIAQNYNNINKILSNHNEDDNLNQRNNQLKTNLENDFEHQPIQNEDNNLELCQICEKNPDIYYLECCHPICYDCFDKYAQKHFYDMKCNICNEKISEEAKKLY